MKSIFRKFLRVLGYTLIILLVMLLTARFVSEFFMQRKFSSFFENMRSKGKLVDIEDLRIPCDDKDNAALPWREIERMFFLVEVESELVNTAYLKMMKRETLSQQEKDGIRKIISNNESSFERFSEVLSKPCFNYVSDWDVSAYDMEIPKAIKMLQMMKLTCLDMYMLAQEGSFEGLMARWRSNYAFSQKVSKGPLLISFLVGVALARGQIELLNLIDFPGSYDHEAYRAIIDQLDPSLWREGFNQSLESERALMFDCYNRLEDNDASLLKEFYRFSVLGWFAQPILKVDFMHAMKFLDEAEVLIQKNYVESKNQFTVFNKQIGKLPPWYVFSLQLVPNFESAFLKEQILEANIIVAAAGIACKAFKVQYGVFPDSLSMLAPEFLPGIPLDPFSGRPLVYKKTGSGFKIYSLGSNMKDDNGVETWEITQLTAEKDDDWIWEEKLK